jgi:L-amino acid N-acyltransferase YncA
MSYDIRLATQADLEQFAEIVNYYIENTTINFHVRPLSDDDWEPRGRCSTSATHSWSLRRPGW